MSSLMPCRPADGKGASAALARGGGLA